jgi:uncharacterized 2Fe-2S/4Fe-4S cluster protein (DUF4445 family)
VNITLTSGKIISASPGVSILEALKNEGVYLNSSCGGKGTCGTCRIILKSGRADIKSQQKLSQEEIASGYTLACKTFPAENIVIDIPKESLLTVEGKIVTGKSRDLQSLLQSTGAMINPLTDRLVLKLPPPTLDDNISDLERLKRELVTAGMGCLRIPFRVLTDLAMTVRKEDWEVTICSIHSEDCHEITNLFHGNQKTPRYGIAVDIGTTTIVMYLVNLEDGALIDAASIYNSQIRFGDDVITRIVNATEHNELNNIHRAVGPRPISHTGRAIHPHCKHLPPCPYR